MHGSIAITQDNGAKGNHSSNNLLLDDKAFHRIKENVRGSFHLTKDSPPPILRKIMAAFHKNVEADFNSPKEKKMSN